MKPKIAPTSPKGKAEAESLDRLYSKKKLSELDKPLRIKLGWSLSVGLVILAFITGLLGTVVFDWLIYQTPHWGLWQRLDIATTSTGGFWEPKPPYNFKVVDLHDDTADNKNILLTWNYRHRDEEGFRVEKCNGTYCSNFVQLGADVLPADSDNFDSGISTSVWNQKGTVYNSNSVAATDTTPAIDLANGLGTVKITPVSGTVEMYAYIDTRNYSTNKWFTTQLYHKNPETLLGPSDFDVQIDFSVINALTSVHNRMARLYIQFPTGDPADPMTLYGGPLT